MIGLQKRSAKAKSIKGKLLLTVGICAIVGLGAATFAEYYLQQNRIEERMHKRYDLAADLFATQLIAPTQFGDIDRIDATVAKFLEMDPQVVAVDIRSPSGELLYSFNKSGQRDVSTATAIHEVENISSESDAETSALANDVYAQHLAIEAPGARGVVGFLTFAIDISADRNAASAEVMSGMLRNSIAYLLAAILLLSQLNRFVARPLKDLGYVVEKIGQKRFEVEVTHTDRGDEIGVISQKLEAFRDQLSEDERNRATRAKEDEIQKAVFSRLATGLSEVASGQLGRSIEEAEFVGLNDAQARIYEDFNALQSNLNKVLTKAASTAESVRASAHEISESVLDQSKRSESQAVTLEESAAAIETLATTVESTAENAAEASDRIVQNRQQAQAGGEVVELTVEAMRNIEESSEQITAIIGVIDDIAFQTNLLALNAGVEAARAGEAGRGFAVVASEVRALAQRASSSANEIKDLIHRSGEQVTKGSELVNKAGEALQEIITGVNLASDLVAQIATGSRSQADNLTEIKDSITELDRVTQRNAAMIEEASAASRNLSAEANSMADVLKTFDLETAPVRSDEGKNNRVTEKASANSGESKASQSKVSTPSSDLETKTKEWDDDAAKDVSSKKAAIKAPKNKVRKPLAQSKSPAARPHFSPEPANPGKEISFGSNMPEKKAVVVNQSAADLASEDWEDF